VLYTCTLCDSTNINTIIEFVPNCLLHVSGDGFNGGSGSYLQFRDNCGKRRNINLILDVIPWKEITWGCICRPRWQLLKPRKSFRITLYFLFSRIYSAPVRYVTKTWNAVLLNKKYIYSNLKCIVHDKLLKP